jgi:hypothetical protein
VLLLGLAVVRARRERRDDGARRHGQVQGKMEKFKRNFTYGL